MSPLVQAALRRLASFSHLLPAASTMPLPFARARALMQCRSAGLLACWLTVLALLCAPARAQQVPAFWQNQYTATDFLANPVNYAIAQDGAGVLYLANPDGILIFDGAHWQLVSTPLPMRHVAVSANGRVFAATDGEVGTLELQPNGALRYQSLTGRLVTAKTDVGEIYQLAVNGNEVYVLAEKGLWLTAQENNDPTNLRKLPNNRLTLVAAALSSDKLWAVSATGTLAALTPAGATPGPAQTGLQPAAVAAAPGGGLIVAAGDGSFYRARATGFTRLPMALPAGQFAFKLAPLPGGGFAAGTYKDGVAIYGPDGALRYRLTRESGLPDNDIFSLFADREGSLWIGHGNGLTHALPGLPAQRLTAARPLSARITSLRAADGAYYAATPAGAWRLGLQQAPQPIAGAGECFDALALAGGQALFATREGLLLASPGGGSRTLLPGLTFTRLLRLPSKPGVVVAASQAGLHRLEDFGDGRGLMPANDTLPLGNGLVTVNSLAEAPDGRLWVGTNTLGIRVVGASGGAGAAAGLPQSGSARVARIEGQLLVTTPAGLALHGPDGARTTDLHELARRLGPAAYVLAVRGPQVVFSTQQGALVCKLEGDALVPQEQGLERLLRAAPSAADITPQGLVVAYQNEAYAFSGGVPAPGAAPTLLFRAVRGLSGDSTFYGGYQPGKAGYAPAPPEGLVLSGNAGDLAVAFALPDYTHPAANRYRYRIGRGQWTAWSPTARADLAGLSVGAHTLEVEATDALGRLVQAELRFMMQPPFYLTWWAFVLYGLLAIGLVVLIVRWRSARLEAENERLNVLVEERTATVVEQKEEIEAQVEELSLKNTELDNTLSELRSTQEQLLQSEKMAALGQLVAGVAHEINTPVGVGVTAVSHLRTKTRELNESLATNQMKKSDLTRFIEVAAEGCDIILTNLHRAADLIQSFKKIAVDQNVEEVIEFEVKDYLESVVTSIKPKLREAELTVAVDVPQGLTMQTLPGAVSQITINMVMNSLIHAYDNKGPARVDITVRPVGADQVEFRFQDYGRGISADNLSKVFNPFFTTNRAKGGSGLGLNIVYNLATVSLKGKIQVESEVGKGTVFTVTLPKVLQEAGGRAVSAHAPQAPQSQLV